MGDVERDGGIKIRTLMLNDSDDEYTLLDIKGGPSGAMDSTIITAIQRFACLPLPTPPKATSALPHSTHMPHTPQGHVSPIIWVREHDSAVHHCPRCFCHHLIPIPAISALYLLLQRSHHHPILITLIFKWRGVHLRGPFSPGTTSSPSNGHQHLPGPLLPPNSTLSRLITSKPLVWT